MKKTRPRLRSSLRRPLPSATIEALLRVAKGEWHGIVLIGWRTGQRLSDIVRLRWSSIDLHWNPIHLHVAKPNSRAEVPMAPSLRDYLTKLPRPLDPDDSLCPGAAKQSLPSLKREFLGLATDAGVDIESFDALRLSFLLDPVAHLDLALVAPLLGQESDTISHRYDTPDLRKLKRIFRSLRKPKRR
jgi:integrase